VYTKDQSDHMLALEAENGTMYAMWLLARTPGPHRKCLAAGARVDRGVQFSRVRCVSFGCRKLGEESCERIQGG